MEYKGQLKNFPTEVVEKMLEHQVSQGNSKDVTVFEFNRQSNYHDGGFDWDSTPEGFWYEVITEEEFDVFFKKYPKSESVSVDVNVDESNRYTVYLKNSVAKFEHIVRFGNYEKDEDFFIFFWEDDTFVVVAKSEVLYIQNYKK